MKSFRHWIFKLLTGYDIVEYEEILRAARKVLEYATSIHEQNKDILELNGRVIKSNHEILELSSKINKDCRDILRVCGKVNENETLG